MNKFIKSIVVALAVIASATPGFAFGRHFVPYGGLHGGYGYHGGYGGFRGGYARRGYGGVGAGLLGGALLGGVLGYGLGGYSNNYAYPSYGYSDPYRNPYNDGCYVDQRGITRCQ